MDLPAAAVRGVAGVRGEAVTESKAKRLRAAKAARDEAFSAWREAEDRAYETAGKWVKACDIVRAIEAEP